MDTPRPESKPVPYDPECKVWKYGRIISKMPTDSLTQSLVFTPRTMSLEKYEKNNDKYSEQDYIDKELELTQFCNQLIDEKEKLLDENDKLKKKVNKYLLIIKNLI